MYITQVPPSSQDPGSIKDQKKKKKQIKHCGYMFTKITQIDAINSMRRIQAPSLNSILYPQPSPKPGNRFVGPQLVHGDEIEDPSSQTWQKVNQLAAGLVAQQKRKRKKKITVACRQLLFLFVVTLSPR